jgi:hypothetical protein
VRAALSICFVDELVDAPCRIAVDVRDGAIAAVTVAPFAGDANRVVVRSLADAPVTLAPAALPAWFAAGNLIQVARAAEAEPDPAITVRALVDACAKARLVGQPVDAPDAMHPLWFSWTSTMFPRVDRQAYVELGVARGASRGPADAPVTIVGFLDLADRWGFGGTAVAAWSAVLARHPDDVRMVIKLCPLAPEHEQVAHAIHAADAQGALWPMLERVGASPARIALDELVAHAAALGLDVARFRAEVEREAFRAVIERDQLQMAAMEFDAVPAALVNGRRVSGALRVETCAGVVEQALRRVACHPG